MNRVLLVALLVAMGCGVSRSPSVRLDRGVTLTPLTTATIGEARARIMRIVIEKPGREPFRFNAHAEVEPDRTVLVGMTPMTTRGFAATWSNRVLDYEHLPFYRLPLPPATLILAYQLMFLPEPVLAPQLAAAGLSLEVGEMGRRLRHDGETLLVVDYEGSPTHGTATLTDHRRGYRLVIETRQLSTYPLEE